MVKIESSFVLQQQQNEQQFDADDVVDDETAVEAEQSSYEYVQVAAAATPVKRKRGRPRKNFGENNKRLHVSNH